jgi:hypothetical protein
MAFWYNVTTKQVEIDDNRSEAVDVLGPFATRAEAEQALESAKRRTKSWDDADVKWEDDDEK